MSERAPRLSRRKFLLAGGAASAATLLAPRPSSKAKLATGSGKRATRGYQASEHVDKYYRTTKV